MIHHPPVVSRRTLLAGAAALPATGLAVGYLAAGCSGEAAPAEPGDPRQVSVLTGLGFQGREAYLDVAAEKGWFAEEGLEVEVLPGEATQGNLTLLAEGTADFATLDVSAALIEYSRGTFTDWRLTSILHHDNLSCIMVLQDSPIRDFADLEGRSVAVIPGGVNTLVLPLLGDLAGFDASRVEQVPLSPPSPPIFASALAEGQVDAVMQFVVGQGAIAALAGRPVRVLPYSDWITDIYGSGLGVAAELAESDPELARRFNRAALRGLEYAIDNPDESGEIFASRREEQNPQAAAGELRALAPYVRPVREASGTLQLGEISVVRLAQNIAVLESLGELEPGIAAEDVAVFGLVR